MPRSTKNIRLAVIYYSNDIPATRKLCGHIFALVRYHQCYKRAGGEDRQKLNFSSFEDMDEWFKMKDPEEYCSNAII